MNVSLRITVGHVLHPSRLLILQHERVSPPTGLQSLLTLYPGLTRLGYTLSPFGLVHSQLMETYPCKQEESTAGGGCATRATEKIISLVSQGHHGINAHGAPRGNITGKQSDDGQHSANEGSGTRIMRADAEEQAGHQLRC